MSAVLAWIKANVFIVVFAAVMVAAVPSLLILSAQLNASVREDVESRNKKLRDLKSLEKTSIEVDTGAGGPESRSVLVNDQLLKRFLEVTEARRADADEILAAAEAHNSKGRGAIMDVLFPAPPPHQVEVLPRRFYEEVHEAYKGLLESVNAGTPPKIDEMLAEIERRQEQFYAQTLQKEPGEPLDEQEQEQLKEELTQARMSRYIEAADAIGFYASIELLDAPVWDQSFLPTMGEMYEWQWQYWIIEDILIALADANSDSTSVLTAPVKRVTELDVWQEAFGGGGQGGGSSGGSGGRGAGVGGPGSRSGGGGAGMPAAEADPKKLITPNYYASFTGRQTNPFYDVREVELSLIVDTARMPEVLDALARRNFITVLDLKIEPTSVYDAVSGGYLYGAAPVSSVTLQLETLWLRTWMAQYMPEEVKYALGVPLEKPEQPQG